MDHAILLDVLQHRFAVDAVPLLWFTSYLTDRTQIYTVDGIQSAPIHLNCSVPQGSVLGPLEFILYTEDIVELLERHRIVHHLFADDKQLLKTTTVADIDCVRLSIGRCIEEVRVWCASRRLQLNASKTELVWFGSRTNLHRLSSVDSTLTVGTDVIHPTTVVRDLGVYLDSELTMKDHINRIARSCFYQLRHLRQIRWPVKRS